MCDTTVNEVRTAASKYAGPTEKKMLESLLRRATVVADDPSPRFASLKRTRTVRDADVAIFGTADKLGIPIITSDGKFLRAAAEQGVVYNEAYLVLPPVSYKGM